MPESVGSLLLVRPLEDVTVTVGACVATSQVTAGAHARLASRIGDGSRERFVPSLTPTKPPPSSSARRGCSCLDRPRWTVLIECDRRPNRARAFPAHRGGRSRDRGSLLLVRPLEDVTVTVGACVATSQVTAVLTPVLPARSVIEAVSACCRRSARSKPPSPSSCPSGFTVPRTDNGAVLIEYNRRWHPAQRSPQRGDRARRPLVAVREAARRRYGNRRSLRVDVTGYGRDRALWPAISVTEAVSAFVPSLRPTKPPRCSSARRGCSCLDRPRWPFS